jgi:hypothetical protein
VEFYNKRQGHCADKWPPGYRQIVTQMTLMLQGPGASKLKTTWMENVTPCKPEWLPLLTSDNTSTDNTSTSAGQCPAVALESATKC